jgi:ABC-type transport system involved in resistance to organic solvents, auxiliary component
MRYFRSLCSIFLLSVLFLPAWPAHAEGPTTQLRTSLNEFVTILTNTPVAELRTKGLPAKALEIVYGRFDFPEMTKRSLGRHWATLTQAQQTEFVDAFTQKLLVAYGRTVRASADEKIQFNREILDGNYAIVETKVSGSGEPLPIDYNLRSVDGQWKVYDMVIDRVSLVNNYRAQFDRVIARSSIKELLSRMKQQDS